MMVAMLALLRQCGAFRAPAASRLAPSRRAAPRLAPTRLLSVSPRIYESSSAAPASYALPVSDALLARVPESVRARDADVVEAYLLDALQLGLGALERVEGAGEARRVAAEFDSLVSRLDTWDARLRERLDAAFATRDARTTAALESYLGSKGRLEATIDGLRVNLSDPTRSTSLVSATAASVSQALEKTTADVRRLLDCADSSSELGKFLAQQREVVASQRGVQAAATAEFVGELRSAYKDLDARLARTLEAVGAEDVRRADVKGRAFELDVYDSLLALASVGGDGVEDTAYEAAAGSRSKVGDALVTLQGGAASVAVEVKSGKFAMAGATSLERSLRDAMDLRGAQAAIGVVRAKHLGKRMGWYTALPGNVVVVAFEPDVRAPGVLCANLSSNARRPQVEHGAVALQCAYKVLRAQVLADALAARDGDGEDAAALRADAIRQRARDILASLDRLRRMKKNATDAGGMLNALRVDLDDLDREIRGALREIDSDLAAAPSG